MSPLRIIYEASRSEQPDCASCVVRGRKVGYREFEFDAEDYCWEPASNDRQNWIGMNKQRFRLTSHQALPSHFSVREERHS